ncbi:hypothetical protein KQ944_11665 [Bacillus subtilis]|nr:hypothetical protein [Bacillus subtilis]
MEKDRILPASPAAQLNAGNRLSGGLLQQSDEYVHFISPAHCNAADGDPIQISVSATGAAATGERFKEILMVITASFMVNLIKWKIRIAPCFLSG